MAQLDQLFQIDLFKMNLESIEGVLNSAKGKIS